jgi:hypothetical protein
MNRFIGITVLVIAASAYAPSMGAITYLTQDRQIRASAFVFGQPQGSGIVAPNYGVFDETISRTFTNGTGSASASQLSRLLPTGVEFTGASSLVVSNFEIENMARSFLDITFVLDAPTPIEIVHAHTVGQTGAGRSAHIALARLTRQTAGTITVFEWSEDFNQPSSWPASPYVSTLSPGEYRLYVEAFTFRASSGAGGFGTSAAQISFAMAIPTPGGFIALGIGLWPLSRRRREAAR